MAKCYWVHWVGRKMISNGKNDSGGGGGDGGGGGHSVLALYLVRLVVCFMRMK